MRHAFVLIETMIAVVIIAGAVLYVFKIEERASDRIRFVKERAHEALEDSLFLLNKEEGKLNAYDSLRNIFTLRSDKVISILRNISRTRRNETEEIAFQEGETIPSEIDTIILKSDTTVSQYYRFQINFHP
jgi:hypothetical protein